MKKHFLTVSFQLIAFLLVGQELIIDSIILNSINEAKIPGIAICKIDSSKVKWKKYFGLADIENGELINSETVFLTSSVSKTVTSAALMKLYGEGKLRLDDDINRYLKFKVFNPNFPEENITIGHLLRHRSSIIDNYQYLMPFWNKSTGDSNIALELFLREYLDLEGENFLPESNFDKNKPGSRFNYSNVGFALIGLLVQEISGMPFNTYCEQNIFNELGMNSSKWHLKDLNEKHIAKQYVYNDSTNIFDFVGFSGFPDYPAGQLRMTLSDYSNFITCWMNNGNRNGKQIFSPAAIEELTPIDFTLGLGFFTWFLYSPSKEEIIYSHFGSDKGSFSFVGYNPWTGKGIIVFVNGTVNRDKRQIVYNLIDRLYNE